MKSIIIIFTLFLVGFTFALPSRNSVPGGWFFMSTDDQTVTRLASIATDHHNSASNSDKKLVSIKSARAQVVAGMNYEITFVISDGSLVSFLSILKLIFSVKIIDSNF